ncbi:MAG: hypothetical protein U0229_05530 [Anaeromyxobacter sp.]
MRPGPAPAAAALAAAALALGACSYDYRNAAEALSAGEVRGRTVADRNGATGAAGGVTVTLKGAALSQASRATGLFSVSPLPTGRHTLLFRKGTALAAEREVDVAFGKDGQLEGLALGDVRLPKAVSVTGQANLPIASTAVRRWGVAVDEVSGATARIDANGAFSFPVLSAGDHLLKLYLLGDTAGVLGHFVGGPVVLALGEADAGKVIDLAPVTLHAAAGNGRAQLRVRGVGADLSPGAVTITGLPGATADSTGLVDVTVPEGHYVVKTQGPAALDGPGAALELVVIADLVADGGTRYFVKPDAATRAARACTGAADCACLDGSCTGTCTSGVCATGFATPAGLVPASVSFCPASALEFCAPTGCATSAFYCAYPSPGAGSCLPCGVTCTTDGASTLAAGPDPLECPP